MPRGEKKPMSIDIEQAQAAFVARFGGAAELGARAPGRVNIIGEHTDYNHGFVLPMAIDRETVLLARRRADRMLNAFAANLNRAAIADLDRCVRDAREPWIDYVVGVAGELAKMGKQPMGVDLFIVGDVPLGCGLSSSASFEMAALTLFEALGEFALAGAEAPLLGQRVENRFLGVNSGIMDQFISRMGKAGHALFLDCRTLEYELVSAAFADAVFVIANTCVARGLTSSKYNERVAECAAAVEGMKKALGKQATHLRDFTPAELDASAAAMPETVFRRARHVISEDVRTRAACAALREGDLVTLGALMNASDASLRDDYEVTCEQLDVMTAIARKLPGCFGSRMTGAGFGGCTISLVAKKQASGFAQGLLEEYKKRTGLTGEVIVSSPAAGARPIRL